MLGGKVVFENNNYKIACDDNNTAHITNKLTGETYEIWGDPHVNIDGVHSFDFWGRTTFNLEDGTKVTIQTVPWSGDASGQATIASKVTITNGDYGVVISGVDSNTTGDLAFEEYVGLGGLVDLATADGNELYENAGVHAKGFVGISPEGELRQVDQAFINMSDELRGAQLSQMETLLRKTLDPLAEFLRIVDCFWEGVFRCPEEDQSRPRRAKPDDENAPSGQPTTSAYFSGTISMSWSQLVLHG
jgi:hypothetical protein